MLKKICLLVTLVAAGPLMGQAIAGGLYLEGHVGYGSYSQDDLNDEVDMINDLAGGDYLDSVDGGIDIGGKMGFLLGSGARAGAELAVLGGSTDYADSEGSIEYKVPAIMVGGFYSHAMSNSPNFELSATVGAGLLVSKGSIQLSLPGYDPVQGDLEGAGLYFQGGLEGTLGLGSQIGLVGQAGYRLAKISEIKIDDETIRNGDGDKYALDYSGVYVRLGLRLYVN